jgi:hypothetical protein
VRSLPAEAQLAPAFGVSVADFDGDGREDLFLAQNFFPTEIGTLRFDAGVGLVLLGDGAGGFRPLAVQESGLVVRGDQRGAAVADFDGDGRVDLAVSQNGAATTLWRNTGGRVGVSVRLEGTAGNPRAVGARLRVIGEQSSGPVRMVTAGSGYWSTDGASIVMAAPTGTRELRVRWPSGAETTIPLAPGARQVVVREHVPARP